MADALARRLDKSGGGEKSPVGDLTAVDWFRFLEEYNEADAKVKAATQARKELRERVKVKLVDPDLITSFDRARKDREVSGEYRSKLDAAYIRIMEWERKPVGFQASVALPLTQADAARVDLEGLEAGKSKHNREDNPYTPGTDEFARWDQAWFRGQAQRGATLTDDKDKKAATLAVVEGGKPPEPPAADQPPAKRRGRPPGTGKKGQDAAATPGTNPPPDQGEGGDLDEKAPGQGDPDQGGPSQGDPEEQPPGGDDHREGEQNAGGDLDRYGSDWPSAGGNGTTTH